MMKKTIDAIKGQCKKELTRWKPYIQSLPYDDLINAVFNMSLYFVYLRKKDKVDSMYFSDYLKEDKGLDHLFYRVCREVEQKIEEMEENKEYPEHRIKRRRQIKKFGIFDVSEVEKRNGYDSMTKKPNDFEAKEVSKKDRKNFPWNINIP